MTARKSLSRSIAAFSAMASVATALALTAAPSTAQAETGTPIIMGEGSIDCAPCRLLTVHDKDGVSFGDIVAEVQNGNEIVITAQVYVARTAGQPRTGSVVFSTFMDAGDDAGSMKYTDDACMSSQMSQQAGTQACTELTRAFNDAVGWSFGATHSGNGIIMRDGGVCDPIRHMGC
jgi:hypothetical protein